MPTHEEKQSHLDAPLVAFGKSSAAIHFQSTFTLSDFAKAHCDLTSQLAGASPSGAGTRVRGHWGAVDVVDLAANEELLDPASSILPRFSLADQGSSDEELKKELQAGFNRQLRWFLVTAFESHERFLKDIYAAIGYLEPGLWRGKDIGNETIATASGKDIEWYRTQVRSSGSRIDCPGIRNHLRTQIPQFGYYEKTTWIDRAHTDFRFLIGVIELFRHLIVHANGETTEAPLWESIARSTGDSLTGESESIHAKKATVMRFCTVMDDRLIIWLFDPNKLENGQQQQATRSFRELFAIIVNYSCMVYSVVCKHFGVSRLWER